MNTRVDCPYLIDGGDCGYFDAPPPENALCFCLADADDRMREALGLPPDPLAEAADAIADALFGEGAA